MSGIGQPLEEVCPYVYETAVSLHLAAKLEGEPIEMNRILKNFDHVCSKYMYAMVPYVIREEELVKVLQTMKE